MNDLQALGNAIAYLRRYGLSAITGVPSRTPTAPGTPASLNGIRAKSRPARSCAPRSTGCSAS